MRHNKKFNHLGRTADHRKALLANLAISLIMHKRITTTVAKAKALKTYVEPLITRSKEDTTNSRRVVFRYLQNKEALKELFGVISAKVADRPGGYTRIIKLGFRQGDAAQICFIELVDFDENMAKTAAKKTATKKATAAKTATATKKTSTAKKEVIYLTAENAGFRAGDVYQALAAAEQSLSLEEIAKQAKISVEDAILGIGWLFKEGKIKEEDNKVALA